MAAEITSNDTPLVLRTTRVTADQTIIAARNGGLVIRVRKTSWKNRAWSQIWTYAITQVHVFDDGRVLFCGERLMPAKDGGVVWGKGRAVWVWNSRDLRDVEVVGTRAW